MQNNGCAPPNLSHRELKNNPMETNKKKGSSKLYHLVFSDLAISPNDKNKVNTLQFIDDLSYKETIKSLSDQLTQGECCATVYEIGQSRALKRLMTFLRLPFLLSGIEHSLKSNGIQPQGRFGVYPNLINPFLLYSLRSPASQYAENNILQEFPKWPIRLSFTILSLWSGCYPTSAGVIVLGIKS